MTSPDDAIGALRRALLVSPENAPLRRHLADSLLALERPVEAEVEYREALRYAPADDDTALGLATAFLAQGRLSEARVIAEDLDERGYPGPALPRLMNRLGIGDGEIEESIEPTTAQPGITFADVGGMELLKEEIRMKAIYPLVNPELFASYGKGVGGGVLMYGPPGCGKTLLARATAGELHGTYLSVGLNDVLDMWVGSSERNLHEIFQHARLNRPSVLFFDEVDALGVKRADMRMSGGKLVINQFLAEFDGANASNEGVVILGATNAPWNLDSAFRRPGRFDQVIFVPPPDTIARAAILELLLEDRPVAGLSFEKLAERSEGFSGADLRGVVDRATEACLRQAMRSGTQEPITQDDLTAAIKNVRPSTDEWFVSARNYVKYANEGGLYDDLAAYLSGR